VKLPSPKIVVLVLLALSTGGLSFQLRYNNPEVDDFFDLWLGSAFVRETGNPHLYGTEGDKAANAFAQGGLEGFDPLAVRLSRVITPFSSMATPFLHAAVSLFPARSFLGTHRIYVAVSFASMAFAFLALSVWLGYDLEYALILWSFLLVFFVPHLSDTGNGNINRIQLGFLAAAWACLADGRRAARLLYGILCGLLVVLKPNVAFAPAALVLSRAVRREWGALAWEAAGGALGALAGIAAGAAFFGSFSVWAEWAARIGELDYRSIPSSSANVSLPALVLSRTGADLAGPLTAVVAALAAFRIARLSRAGREKEAGSPPLPDFGHDLRACVSGLAVYLLCGSIAWVHYYLLALPAAMLVLSPPAQQGMGTARRLASWPAFFCLALLHNAVFGFHSPAIGEVMLWGGAAATFLLATGDYPSSGCAMKIGPRLLD
jgi:hypothetical protein